jgi:gliding motility-associated-like protein
MFKSRTRSKLIRIVLLNITSSGNLNLLINGNSNSGYIDVLVYNIPPGQAPCNAVKVASNQIGCSYAQNPGGCTQFGTQFGCNSNAASPYVTAGQQIMIIAQNWSGTSSTFTLQLGTGAGTGPFNATINQPGPLCSSGSAVQLTAATGGGTWSGSGVTSTGVFNPSTAGAGTHTVSYSVGAAPCTGTDSKQIVVNPPPDATINGVGPYCTGDSPATLTAATGGGTWSGTGITNSSSGTFSPSTAGVGTHTITYTVSTGGCSDTKTTQIVVNNSSDPTINSVSPLCTSDSPVTLTAATGGGTWSGPGGASSGTFNPSTAGSGTHTITYTISGACGGTDTESIIVNANASAAINSVGPYCITSAPVNLVAADPGGTWSGTGITDAQNGTFDPSVAGVGTHVITYTISGQCGDVGTKSIQVVPLKDATINNVSTLCSDATPIALTAATTGGIWAGNGIVNSTNGTFDPAIAGVGTHMVSYTISGTCGNSDTALVVVELKANATINPSGPYCENDGIISLSAATQGGTWSGNGIQNPSLGTFDPSLAGVGTHVVTYTISGNCGNSGTYSLVVNDMPPAPQTISDTTCGNQVAVLSALGGFGVFNWYADSMGNTLLQTGGTSYNPLTDTLSADTSYVFWVEQVNGNCKSSLSPVYYQVYNINASFIPTPDSGEISLDVVFTNNSQGVDSSDIYIWDFAGLGSSSDINPQFTFEELGTYVVTLTIIKNNGLCVSVFSDTIITSGVSDIVIPNIFSPNNDNYNDLFNAISKHVKDIRGKIFNRWGQLVYVWDSNQGGWDGRTISGTIAPPGIYYYIINAIGKDEKTYEYTGTVTLVR